MSVRKRNLVLVSTLGQARNAINLAKDYDQEIYIAILYTSANKEIPITIEKYINTNNINSCFVKLPLRTNQFNIKNMRRFVLLYKQLIDSNIFYALWVANNNNHYNIALSIAKARLLKTIFFEEGLGSYKKIESIYFPRNQTWFGWKKFNKVHYSADMQKIKDNKYTILHATALFNFLKKRTKAAVQLIIDNSKVRDHFVDRYIHHARDYKGVFNHFDLGIFTFPSALDDSYSFGEIFQYDFVKFKKSFDLLGNNSFSSDPIYISQKYGSDPKWFYRLVASALSTMECDRLAIRFHPREMKNERALLLSALSSVGISAYEIEGLGDRTAEQAVQFLKPSLVLGLTSSSLIYLKRLPFEIPRKSIAPLVLKDAKSLTPTRKQIVALNLINDHYLLLCDIDPDLRP